MGGPDILAREHKLHDARELIGRSTPTIIMSGRMIGQHTEKALLRRAEEVMIEKARTSEIFDVEAEQLIPRFKRSGECLLHLLPLV